MNNVCRDRGRPTELAGTVSCVLAVVAPGPQGTPLVGRSGRCTVERSMVRWITCAYSLMRNRGLDSCSASQATGGQSPVVCRYSQPGSCLSRVHSRGPIVTYA
jgi:hypothetical protein